MNLTARKLTTTAGALALILGGGLAMAPTASAAQVAYNGACGTGYKVIRSVPMSTFGTGYLTYSSATGNNCVVIMNGTGTAQYMSARIVASNGGTVQEDYGYFTSYAGPVYYYAPGQCVDWGGLIDQYYRWVENDACG
ncbi:spore-associated protein A [Streptomyces microflavus]|uniref:spore-associated protein A n=1 Tax=Streptomyces microflavus TaxID=1919 RepID=UPI00365E3756